MFMPIMDLDHARMFCCPQSLIPDIRPCLGQEAVVDLHPEEAALSGAEDEEQEHSDQDLQIRRTVTQVSQQQHYFSSVFCSFIKKNI